MSKAKLVAKDAVGFEAAGGTPLEGCSICRFFLPSGPNSEKVGKCELVEGDISPLGVSELFRRIGTEPVGQGPYPDTESPDFLEVLRSNDPNF